MSAAPRPYSLAARRSVGVLRGTVIGPRGGARLTVQERRGDRWVKVDTVRTTRSGGYRWQAHSSGTYRVVVAGAAGPAVKLR